MRQQQRVLLSLQDDGDGGDLYQFDSILALVTADRDRERLGRLGDSRSESRARSFGASGEKEEDAKAPSERASERSFSRTRKTMFEHFSDRSSRREREREALKR